MDYNQERVFNDSEKSSQEMKDESNNVVKIFEHTEAMVNDVVEEGFKESLIC